MKRWAGTDLERVCVCVHVRDGTMGGTTIYNVVGFTSMGTILQMPHIFIYYVVLYVANFEIDPSTQFDYFESTSNKITT